MAGLDWRIKRSARDDDKASLVESIPSDVESTFASTLLVPRPHHPSSPFILLLYRLTLPSTPFYHFPRPQSSLQLQSHNMPVQIATTKRCLGPVSALMIRPDGGRSNIGAKTVATLWYLLVLPDAQVRFRRHLYHKRMPWYAPSRIIGAALAAANILTMPLSWGLLFAGRRNASRLAALGVLFNPPSVQLTMLLISEVSATIARRSTILAKTVGGTVARPFGRKGNAEEAIARQEPQTQQPKSEEQNS